MRRLSRSAVLVAMAVVPLGCSGSDSTGGGSWLTNGTGGTGGGNTGATGGVATGGGGGSGGSTGGSGGSGGASPQDIATCELGMQAMADCGVAFPDLCDPTSTMDVCGAGCILNSDCAALVATFQNDTPDPALMACMNVCLGSIGVGGMGGMGGTGGVVIAGGTGGSSGSSGTGATGGVVIDPVCGAMSSDGFFPDCSACLDSSNCDSIQVGSSIESACGCTSSADCPCGLICDCYAIAPNVNVCGICVQ